MEFYKSVPEGSTVWEWSVWFWGGFHWKKVRDPRITWKQRERRSCSLFAGNNARLSQQSRRLLEWEQGARATRCIAKCIIFLCRQYSTPWERRKDSTTPGILPTRVGFWFVRFLSTFRKDGPAFSNTFGLRNFVQCPFQSLLSYRSFFHQMEFFFVGEKDTQKGFKISIFQSQFLLLFLEF